MGKDALKAFGDVKFLELKQGRGSSSKRAKVAHTDDIAKASPEDVVDEWSEEEEAENDECREGADNEPAVARCRFAQPEHAASATTGLTEVEGSKVSVALLEGADEE